MSSTIDQGLREKIARNYREFRNFQDGYIPHTVESEAFADWFLALPEIDPTPLRLRILAALGGLRDDMAPEDVSAVQRFVDRLP